MNYDTIYNIEGIYHSICAVMKNVQRNVGYLYLIQVTHMHIDSL